MSLTFLNFFFQVALPIYVLLILTKGKILWLKVFACFKLINIVKDRRLKQNAFVFQSYEIVWLVRMIVKSRRVSARSILDPINTHIRILRAFQFYFMIPPKWIIDDTKILNIWAIFWRETVDEFICSQMFWRQRQWFIRARALNDF